MREVITMASKLGMSVLAAAWLLIFVTGCNSVGSSDEQTSEPATDATLYFEPTIESLQQYEAADWFRDAKLGIYLHWGAYSVVERGEWYPRYMYEEGRPEYEHHLENYGHPSEFGYKDIIPLWKAENFDPDKLVKLFKFAGAKYFSPVAVHHDNFEFGQPRSEEGHHRYVAQGDPRQRSAVGRHGSRLS
jgi:alpha-L-fucosidase